MIAIAKPQIGSSYKCYGAQTQGRGKQGRASEALGWDVEEAYDFSQ